jgi:carboxyl-terminal processing protease
LSRRRFGIAIVALALAGSAPAQQPTAPAQRPRSIAEDLQLFSQVLNQIRVNHPDSMDTHAVLMAAIEGMVRATDPHSFVIPAVRLDSARQRALEDGRLAPVPIAFVYTRGVPVVASVAPGTRAATLDILVGDELLESDGRRITAESADELDIALAGVKGSSVSLKFSRRRLDGSRVTIDRMVKRERLDEQSAVAVAQLTDSITGYVRITTFANSKVADDVNSALQRLERGGMKRLLLDLRDNGGGLVSEASAVAGAFLEKGTIVYTSTGRKESVKHTEKVSRSFWNRARNYPVVVLVNSGSASASELLAGSLQDHDRALIVGRPTFGKALLMQGVPLTDGSLMMLVVGFVKTPCGRIIQRQYRNVRTSDYWRDAGAEQDTVGRPSCKTDAGRTVFGGGGIYPDVVLPNPEPVPVWLSRLDETELPLRWAGAFQNDSAGRRLTIELLIAAGGVDDAAVAEFRKFAAGQADIPTGAESNSWLRRRLGAEVARVRFGEAGYFRAIAATDPWIRQATAAFDNAASLLSAKR